jgi:hypothetical protein
MIGKVDLFLDSGAFTNKTQEKKVILEDYITFIKANKQVNLYSVFDVIGSPKETYKNQKKMEHHGLSPIPCFHYREDTKWLLKYLDEGYKYISIGGLAGKEIATNEKTNWLDFLFGKYLGNRKDVKTHGFGVSSIPMITNYPWFSVDSSVWVRKSRLGMIPIPRKNKGEWDFTKEAYYSQITKSSFQNKHISPIIKRYIEEWLRENKFEWEEMQNYKNRDLLNVKYWVELGKKIPINHLGYKTKVYLSATGPCNENVPNERGFLPIPKRLLSFYFIKNKQMDTHIVFENIVKHNMMRRGKHENK